MICSSRPTGRNGPQPSWKPGSGRRSHPRHPLITFFTAAPDLGGRHCPAGRKSLTLSDRPGCLSRGRVKGEGANLARRVAPPEPVALFRTRSEQRTLLSSLVSIWARQTGEPHALIHAELRRSCGGPPVAQATVTQIQSRIDLLRTRLGKK